MKDYHCCATCKHFIAEKKQMECLTFAADWATKPNQITNLTVGARRKVLLL